MSDHLPQWGFSPNPRIPSFLGGRGREGGRDTAMQMEEAGRERDRGQAEQRETKRQRQRERKRETGGDREVKRDSCLSTFSLYEASVCLLKRIHQLVSLFKDILSISQ